MGLWSRCGQLTRSLAVALVACCASGAAVAVPAVLDAPNDETYTEQDARRMEKAASTVLAPVYAPLAAQIVSDLHLESTEGIGIDLGSGPGDLVIELCKRTNLHWVNADINPHFFPRFYEKAAAAGVGHRVSALFADAQRLPFRDGYAQVIVSRGCFFYWQDKARAFSEIYRVLKPGGVAYIGRGFSRDLPAAVAQGIRAAQKQEKPDADGPANYDPAEAEKELRAALNAAGIPEYQVDRPAAPDGAGKMNYGIWVTFRKPL